MSRLLRDILVLPLPRLAGALVLGQHQAHRLREQVRQRRQLVVALGAAQRLAKGLAGVVANERADEPALEEHEVGQEAAGATVALDEGMNGGEPGQESGGGGSTTAPVT